MDQTNQAPRGKGRPPGKHSGVNKSGVTAMHRGMTRKRAFRLERIARLSADPAGFSNEQIAAFEGCTPQTIVYIRQLPEYHAKVMEVATNVTSQFDAQLRENIDNMRDEIRSMVPSATMVIKNAIYGKYGPNLQFKAAESILDREGTLAKVSKSSVAVEIKPALDISVEITNNLMALLGSAPVNAGVVTGAAAGVVEGSFTKTAKEAERAQAVIADEATSTIETLESLDLSNAKPN